MASSLSADQDTEFLKVCAFLSDPASYGNSEAEIEIHRTHGAVIFLIGEDAYKIKQPVKYPYLDFSTLEKRFEICQQELALNQKNAPGIYKGLIPITRQEDGSLKLNGSGTPIEWAVHMARFDSNCLLDHIANDGSFTKLIATSLAREIASFHQALPPRQIEDGAERMLKIIQQIETVFEATAAHLPDNLPQQFIRRATENRQQNRAALDQRAKAGLIRHCHGDLHLQNILLLAGKPTLFDALEFDEELATIDVLYDLAFLLMDLNHHNLKHHACTLFSRYILEAWPLTENHGVSVMPLFMALRAAIRAMVAAEAADLTPENEREKQQEAASYLQQAISFFTPTSPRLYAIGGLSGSGKSTLAHALSPLLEGPVGAIRLRSDVTRKLIFKLEEFAPSPDWVYTPENIQRVYDELYEKAAAILAEGQSVMLDAVFSRPHERAAVRDLAAKLNLPFTALWLEADGEVLQQRVRARIEDASDADEAVVSKQLKRTSDGVHCEQEGWIKLDANGTPDQCLQNALEVIKAANKT